MHDIVNGVLASWPISDWTLCLFLQMFRSPKSGKNPGQQSIGKPLPSSLMHPLLRPNQSTTINERVFTFGFIQCTMLIHCLWGCINLFVHWSCMLAKDQRNPNSFPSGETDDSQFSWETEYSNYKLCYAILSNAWYYCTLHLSTVPGFAISDRMNPTIQRMNEHARIFSWRIRDGKIRGPFRDWLSSCVVQVSAH